MALATTEKKGVPFIVGDVAVVLLPHGRVLIDAPEEMNIVRGSVVERTLQENGWIRTKHPMFVQRNGDRVHIKEAFRQCEKQTLSEES